MPKVISIPTNVGFVRSDFYLVRAIGSQVSPFSGNYRSQEYDSVYWGGSVTTARMNREQANEWKAFLLELNGPVNYFQFGDPDHFTPLGTYGTGGTGRYLRSDMRISDGSSTVSFSGSTITSSDSVFTNAAVGDFIFITGATNSANNGTFKVATVTSATVVVVEESLTTESSTSGVAIRSNQKGATGLLLDAQSNSATGTIKKGDFLAITSSTGTITADNVTQYVMCTEDATLNVNSGADHYSVRIQPKLRASAANNVRIGIGSAVNRGLFRLASPTVQWSSNRNSIMDLTFDFIEVI